MGDSKQGGSEGQAPADPQPPEGTGTPAQDAGAQTGQDPSATDEASTSAASQDDRDAEVSRLRREAAGLRTENKRLREAEDARTNAALSETERLQKRITDLETENTDLKRADAERTVRLSVMEHATAMNFRNPEVAYRMIDMAAVETNEQGSPTNVERLLKKVAEKEPYLLKPNTTTPDFGGGNRGGTPLETPNMNDLLRRASGH